MTLWEKFILRTGFRNTYRGGQCTGFQFKFFIPNSVSYGANLLHDL